MTQRHDHRPGGDLRPGAVDHPLRGRGRRGPHRQRHASTACPAACGRGDAGAGQEGRPAHPHRPDRGQRRRASTRTRRSVATSSRATAASTASTASRSSWRSSPCSCSPAVRQVAGFLQRRKGPLHPERPFSLGRVAGLRRLLGGEDQGGHDAVLRSCRVHRQGALGSATIASMPSLTGFFGHCGPRWTTRADARSRAPAMA